MNELRPASAATRGVTYNGQSAIRGSKQLFASPPYAFNISRCASTRSSSADVRFSTKSFRLAHLGQELLDMREHEVAPCVALDVIKAGQGDKGRVGKALSGLPGTNVFSLI